MIDSGLGKEQMSSRELSGTAGRAIRAYGGAERWQAATGAEARVTMSGLPFHLKSRHLPPGARIAVELKEPFAKLHPVDRRGRVGVLSS